MAVTRLASAKSHEVQMAPIDPANEDTGKPPPPRQPDPTALAQIDAPEKSQDFGQVSKQALSDLVYGKDVTIEVETIDKYGRTVGKVLVGGVDANLQQVAKGLACSNMISHSTTPVFMPFRFRSDSIKKRLDNVDFEQSIYRADRQHVIPAWMPESSHKDVNLGVAIKPFSNAYATDKSPSLGTGFRHPCRNDGPLTLVYNDESRSLGTSQTRLDALQ